MPVEIYGPHGPIGPTGPQGPAGDISASSIDELIDVDTTTTAPTDGQALVWDNASGLWVPGSVGGGGGSSVPEVIPFIARPDPLQWSNQPAALTEYNGNTWIRAWVDLTNAVDARLVCRVAQAGATNAQYRVQYSIDEVAWNYLDEVAGPGVPVGSVGTNKSAWVALAAGAKADVVLRVVGIDGDSVADPQVSALQLQVR